MWRGVGVTYLMRTHVILDGTLHPSNPLMESAFQCGTGIWILHRSIPKKFWGPAPPPCGINTFSKAITPNSQSIPPINWPPSWSLGRELQRFQAGTAWFEPVHFSEHISNHASRCSQLGSSTSIGAFYFFKKYRRWTKQSMSSRCFSVEKKSMAFLRSPSRTSGDTGFTSPKLLLDFTWAAQVTSVYNFL